MARGKINKTLVNGIWVGNIPTPTKETSTINILKNDADERIIAPKFLVMLILPAVRRPHNAPKPALENKNPNSLGVPLKISMKAGKAWIYPNMKKFVQYVSKIKQ